MGWEGMMLAALFLMGVSLALQAGFFAVSVLVSKRVWRWALLRLSRGETVTLPHVVSLVVLVATGLPIYMPVVAIRYGVDPLSISYSVVVGVVCLAALTHAAYRTESIRGVGKNTALASALAEVPYAGNRDFHVLETARERGLPTFSGEIRLRSFAIAALVAVAWVGLALVAFPYQPPPVDY